MDSKSSSLDGSPNLFHSKIFPLPHLNVVLCGTGVLQVVLDWYVFIQSQVLATNIHDLDNVAPTVLSELLKRYENQLPEGQGRVTIYHFGYDERAGRMRAFVYRSTSGFVSEVLPEGAIAKPGRESLLKLWAEKFAQTGDAIDAFIDVMEQQRRMIESGELEPVPIGGEIHALIAMPDFQTMWRCHQFGDHADDLLEIRKRMRSRPIDVSKAVSGYLAGRLLPDDSSS